MMAQTADGIVYPTSGDQISPSPSGLAGHFQDLAESISPAIASAQGRPWRMLEKIGGASVLHDSWTSAGGWAGVQGDPGNSSGISYSSGGFTYSQPGLYYVYAQAALHGPTYNQGTKAIRFVKGGIQPAIGSVYNLSGQQTVSCSFIGYMNSGTVVTAEVRQTSSSAMSWQEFTGWNLLLTYMIAPDIT